MQVKGVLQLHNGGASPEFRGWNLAGKDALLGGAGSRSGS
jgi:hypothetical protein